MLVVYLSLSFTNLLLFTNSLQLFIIICYIFIIIHKLSEITSTSKCIRNRRVPRFQPSTRANRRWNGNNHACAQQTSQVWHLELMHGSVKGMDCRLMGFGFRKVNLSDVRFQLKSRSSVQFRCVKRWNKLWQSLWPPVSSSNKEFAWRACN